MAVLGSTVGEKANAGPADHEYSTLSMMLIQSKAYLATQAGSQRLTEVPSNKSSNICSSCIPIGPTKNQ